MAFLKIFSSKTPEEYERKGDALFKSKAFGDAKLEYEAGLYKLEKKFPDDSVRKGRLQEKIMQSKEALALAHKQRGEEMLASQYYEGAEDVFRLAMELTDNQDLKVELRERLNELEHHYTQDEMGARDSHYEKANAVQQHHSFQEDEHFEALCGAFSDREREKAYHSYGDTFKEGFVALNQGDFQLAETKLSQAMEENPPPKNYIPLELGAVYLNLGRIEDAGRLLTSFLKDHPDSLPGYQLLCETFWVMKTFDQARELLNSCPQSIVTSPHILLLKGETLFQAERYEEAEVLFRDYLESSAWDESIALSLAGTYEALGELEKARDLYGRMMDACGSCGRQVAPFIKQRYSDLSLACGQCSIKILELYLSLVQEDPDNKAHYYEKIIEIYTSLGNEKEVRRYQAFARESV